MTNAEQWRHAFEPLLGNWYAVQLRSQGHTGKVVELSAYRTAHGQCRVQALVPMDDYRWLFREDFTTETDARAFWREQYADLFGTHWELQP